MEAVFCKTVVFMLAIALSYNSVLKTIINIRKNNWSLGDECLFSTLVWGIFYFINNVL